MNTNSLDAQNAAFWNELCGSGLALQLGIKELSRENLRKFDTAYLSIYPYLTTYFAHEPLEGKKVLEIGLGYGTLGHQLALRGCDYYGLDIAENPVAMMRYRLAQLKQDAVTKVHVGSALHIPYADEGFDYVYSIGCLHHTGNLSLAVSEVHRVLKPGGKAIIMLYNRYSLRRMIQVPLGYLYRTLIMHQRRGYSEHARSVYDVNLKGEAAPHVEVVSLVSAKRLFQAFSSLNIDIQNFFYRGLVIIPREKLLNNLARIVGQDLYITAQK